MRLYVVRAGYHKDRRAFHALSCGIATQRRATATLEDVPIADVMEALNAETNDYVCSFCKRHVVAEIEREPRV